MLDGDKLLESIRTGLSQSTGEAVSLEWGGHLAGGDINQAALLTDGKRQWFLKYHSNAPAGMFAAEAWALREISGTGCIRAPAPVAYGTTGDTDWLVLEYIDLHRSGSESLLGEHLAALHRVSTGTHGWDHDNYIGSTPQINARHADWVEFWRDCRLRPQLEMAQAAGFRGHLAETGSRLLENLHLLLAGHEPLPSLLHGDLWSGNKAFTQDGWPVIFDPASYYGDRETDIAMTELFGGFGPGFYAAYQSSFPLTDGYRLRRDLYKLYHLLNHLNLFGGGYLSRCERIINSLLSQVL
jgi:fructosamine-3-kinase